MYAADEAYDTVLLRRMRDQSDWVRQRRGSHVGLAWASYNSNKVQKAYERPFASVHEATILRIPWYVHERLSKVHLRILCRVSNGVLDSNDGEFSYADDRINLRLWLQGDAERGDDQSFLPRGPSSSLPEWYIDTMTYEPDDLAAVRDTYDTLALSIRSDRPQPVSETLHNGSPTGYVAGSRFDSGVTRTPWRIKADTDNFYNNGSATDAPVNDANEICATALVYRPSLGVAEGYLRGWVNHVRAQEDVSGRAMYVWPPKNLITRVGEEDGVNWVERWQIPYIQIRALEFWEEYE